MRLSGKACILGRRSPIPVTTSPRPIETSALVLPWSASTFSDSRAWSLIMDAPMLSHRAARSGAKFRTAHGGRQLLLQSSNRHYPVMHIVQVLAGLIQLNFARAFQKQIGNESEGCSRRRCCSSSSMTAFSRSKSILMFFSVVSSGEYQKQSSRRSTSPCWTSPIFCTSRLRSLIR